MKDKIGTVCMVGGAVLVLAALSLFIFNRREEEAAGDWAERTLPQVIGQIGAAAPEREEGFYPDPYDPAMPTAQIDGYDYLGVLSIPAIGLALPVMDDWDEERLKLAPCRYAGSAKTGDLVLCAHNYDRHFGLISRLEPGDAVCFTDMDGIVWQYETAAVEILAPNDVENMTAGDFALTLFTCTYGGGSRVAVRCGYLASGSPVSEEKK